jgi:hypothetical protein
METKMKRAVCFEKETKVEAGACLSCLENRFGGVAGEFFKNDVAGMQTRLLDIAARREAKRPRHGGPQV